MPIDDLIKYYSREQKSIGTKEHTEVEKILLKKIEELDTYILGSYKSALAFSTSQIQERLKAKIKDPNVLEAAVHEFTEKHESHSFPITLHKLQEYGLGTLIKEPASINAVKTLLAVYQSFMAGNNIVKTIGNRDMNRNVIIQSINKVQIPTKTSINS